MVDVIDDAEWKRREYELKRHQMLMTVFETEYERQQRLATLAVIGNLGGLATIWNGLKDYKGHVQQIPVWTFGVGAMLAVISLSMIFITAGAMKTIWRQAAARHFNPPADVGIVSETKLRKTHWNTSKAADTALNWSSVCFLMGVLSVLFFLGKVLQPLVG